MQKRFASQGFTIIETMFVLSIIAIIAALAIPRLGSSANQRELEMVAQNLVSDIRLVQQLNINSGGIDAKNATIYFSTENGRQYYFVIANQAEMKKVYLPNTVKWTTTPKNIRFSVTGAPGMVYNISSSQTIRLVSSGGNPLFIKIAPITGRVRVTDVESTGNE